MRVVLPAVLAVSLLLGACGSGGGDVAERATSGTGSVSATASADVQTFVGKVTGTDAFVAVQTSGNDALVYFCDGQKIWSLFEGPLAGNSIELRDPTGATVAAALTERTASGTVTFADGVTRSFDAEVASSPAGLFFDASRNGTQVTFKGWVRLSDDEVRGKTVQLAEIADGDAELAGVDDGGAIPPTADPEPVARRVSLIKCAGAMMNLAKAKRAVDEDPSADNIAARTAALAAAATACGNPGTAAS